MNTKTSYKYAHNFYDGGNNGVGRDSPGALLDMLAEVASQTLHSEARHIESDLLIKSKQKAEAAKRKAQELYLNLPQILSMPATQLVKHFTVFTSDELKRQYSYMCALVPGCEQKYTSFASEGKARVSITAHLADHLEYLKNNGDSYTTFKATTVKYSKPKAGVQSKKHKVQQLKKPQETPNKENKLVKSEKSTSYLRKILSNEMNFKEFEKQKKLESQNRGQETCAMETKKKPDLETEFKVLGDHSYYEQVKTEPIDDDNIHEEVIKEAMAENIMLMVVESDSVHMKELPYIPDDMAGQSNPECNSDYMDCKSWSDEMCERSSEATVPAKPKGKAKFIGTSKEEREMALVLIDRIKKKGNPTGSNLQCRICDPPRSFTAPTTLVSHYRSHAGIKPYECRICRSVFTRRHSLKYHMLIHQNQTRFTCADCGKKFRHPSHFREHRRRHTGESPFGCDDCGQRFKTRNTYKRHLKTRHGKVLTTTGELLCLTEEEFQKVQTNRKRKSQSSVSSDVVPDEDAVATEAIVEYTNSDYNDNSQENNNESIEDYHVQAMAAQNRDDIDEAIVNIDKTDIIETEVTLESTSFHGDDDSNNRVIYDCITEENHTEYENSALELLQTVRENRQQNFEERDEVFEEGEEVAVEVYQEEPPVADENEYIASYDCEAESHLKNEQEDNETTNQITVKRADEAVSMDEEQIEYCEEFCDETQNEYYEEFRDDTQNETTQLNVQYAYKIRGNVQYQLHVIPGETVEFDNSQSYHQPAKEVVVSDEAVHLIRQDSQNIVYRSMGERSSCQNNNNPMNRRLSGSENEDFPERAECPEGLELMVSPKQPSNTAASVKNGTIVVLSKESLEGGYFRIDSNNVVVKEANPLASIAVPQK